MLGPFSKFISQSSIPQGLLQLHQPRKIPILPEQLKDGSVMYDVIGGRVRAKIQKEFYGLEEPVLSEDEQQTFLLLKNVLYEIIEVDVREEDAESYLEKTVGRMIAELGLIVASPALQKILYLLYRDFIGYGKLEVLFNDSLVSSIQYDGTVSVTHRLYGQLQTDILLHKDEIIVFLRKLLLRAGIPLEDGSLSYDTNLLHGSIFYSEEDPEQSRFSLTKKQKQYHNPLFLMQKRRASPEMFAYLWLLLEDKQPFFIVKDTDVLVSLSYFLPPKAVMLTNVQDYLPQPNTETIIGVDGTGEDYAFLDNVSLAMRKSTVVSSIEKVEEKGNIVCYVEDMAVQKIKENGYELFDGKTLRYSLDSSAFIKSKGNKVILLEEFQLRTKLLHYLTQHPVKEKDFRKIVCLYYENPVAVLKRARLI